MENKYGKLLNELLKKILGIKCNFYDSNIPPCDGDDLCVTGSVSKPNHQQI